MEEYLIVDGYNIIGAWPELNKLKDSSLEDARDKLIEIMANYQGYSGMKVIVVFDAHQVPGLGGKYKQSKLQIVYTKEKETADESIERLVAGLSHRRRRIHVATSDYVEQHVTFGQGALRISARELLIEIEQIRKEIQSRIRTGESHHDRRNTFDSKLSGDLRHIFEKWRRGE
jgi:predicted RNA-binding protein with PIN domain